MKQIVSFMKLRGRTKLLFIEAFITLGLSRALIRILKFKRIAKLLGRRNMETEHSDAGIDIKLINRIALSIRCVSKHTPWRSNCLVQAYAAELMLARRKIASTLYLGVGKDKDGAMIAHAWLRCGNRFVAGGDGSTKYTITNRFAKRKL